MISFGKKWGKKLIRGIGLLELMLSLAIIAILLVFVTQYFQRAQQNQQITAAIQAFQGVYAACASAMLDNQPCTSLSDLVTGGYLPGSYSGDNPAANPFGGAMSLTPPLTVEMDGVPSGKTCDRIAQQLAAGLTGDQTMTAGGTTFTPTSGDASSDVTCGGSGGSIIVNYSGGTSASGATQ